MSSKRAAEHDATNEPESKKARTTVLRHHALRHKQPGALLPLALPQDGSIVEQELTRSLCLALHAAGFDGAMTEALESFRAHVDSYMTNFALWTAHSMRHARRTQPIPEDFAVTLARFGLTPTSLTPDLRLSAPVDVTQRAICFPDLDITSQASPAADLFAANSNLSGVAEKRQKSYIPKHFPDFPSQHTYKDTPVMTQRETDARKLREQSMQEGILAEQALRRLMAARQRGNRSAREHKMGTRPVSKEQQESDKVYQEALNALMEMSGEGNGGHSGDADALDSFNNVDGDSMGPTDIDFGAIVNHDRVNWRISARDWVPA